MRGLESWEDCSIYWDLNREKEKVRKPMKDGDLSGNELAVSWK